MTEAFYELSGWVNLNCDSGIVRSFNATVSFDDVVSLDDETGWSIPLSSLKPLSPEKVPWPDGEGNQPGLTLRTADGVVLVNDELRSDCYDADRFGHGSLNVNLSIEETVLSRSRFTDLQDVGTVEWVDSGTLLLGVVSSLLSNGGLLSSQLTESEYFEIDTEDASSEIREITSMLRDSDEPCSFLDFDQAEDGSLRALHLCLDIQVSGANANYELRSLKEGTYDTISVSELPATEFPAALSVAPGGEAVALAVWSVLNPAETNTTITVWRDGVSETVALFPGIPGDIAYSPSGDKLAIWHSIPEYTTLYGVPVSETRWKLVVYDLESGKSETVLAGVPANTVHVEWGRTDAELIVSIDGPVNTSGTYRLDLNLGIVFRMLREFGPLDISPDRTRVAVMMGGILLQVITLPEPTGLPTA